MKRILAILIAMIMCLGVFAVGASASTATIPAEYTVLGAVADIEDAAELTEAAQVYEAISFYYGLNESAALIDTAKPFNEAAALTAIQARASYIALEAFLEGEADNVNSLAGRIAALNTRIANLGAGNAAAVNAIAADYNAIVAHGAALWAALANDLITEVAKVVRADVIALARAHVAFAALVDVDISKLPAADRKAIEVTIANVLNGAVLSATVGDWGTATRTFTANTLTLRRLFASYDLLELEWAEKLPSWLSWLGNLPNWMQFIARYIFFGWIFDIWPAY